MVCQFQETAREMEKGRRVVILGWKNHMIYNLHVSNCNTIYVCNCTISGVLRVPIIRMKQMESHQIMDSDAIFYKNKTAIDSRITEPWVEKIGLDRIMLTKWIWGNTFSLIIPL